MLSLIHICTSIVRHEHQVDFNRGINAINLFDEKQLLAAENFLTRVMRSDKGGIKSVNDGLAVLIRCLLYTSRCV